MLLSIAVRLHLVELCVCRLSVSFVYLVHGKYMDLLRAFLITTPSLSRLSYANTTL